jgi:CheY-like chemotaxis protein
MAQDRAAGGAGREAISIRYASMEAARRDRLADVPSGLIVRARQPLRRGDAVAVRLELEKEGAALDLDGEVLWLTPLLAGALAGVRLSARAHRTQVQLDVLFGHRTAGPPREPPRMPEPASAPRAGPRALSIALLEPNPVFRTVLANALARLGHGWDVTVAAAERPDELLAALGSEPRALAIVDCDVLGVAADALLHAIRSHEGWERLPVILLGAAGRATLQDPFAVFMKKPFETKPFLDLVRILLIGAGR